MIKLSVNETKCSSLLARTRALILFISIGIFDFGPETLTGVSRNGPQALSSLARSFFSLLLSHYQLVVASRIFRWWQGAN